MEKAPFALLQPIVYTRQRKEGRPLMTSESQRGRPFFDKVFTRKRNRTSYTAIADPNFILPGLRRDEMKKHRSCKVHQMSYTYGEQTTRKQAERIEDEFGTACCFFDGIPRGTRSMKSKRAHPVSFKAKDTSSYTVSSEATDTSYDPVPSEAADMNSDSTLSEQIDMGSNLVSFQGTYMNSNSFADHLERLWKNLPVEKLAQSTYLECVWFGLYRKESQRTKVLSWIKKKNIFTRKYVFVPICCWSHWNVLILCHFGESLDSESKKPCMLLLDSLHMAEPMRLEQEIRKFVLDICKQEGILDRRVSKIRLTVPKVPQQRNKECGFYSLYFIKKFMETAPETISNGDMPFIDQNWFTREQLDGFCIALDNESKAQTQLEAMTSQEMLHESCSEGDVIIIND